jgi:hypothetical protein
MNERRITELWNRAVAEIGDSTYPEIITRFAEFVALDERERICTAIKVEDDHCADGDYMMDSDDCISVARGTWKRPDWNGSNVK